jgi:hypothetical protein
MGSPAGRSGIVASAVLSWWMLLGGPTFGQEDGLGSAALPSLDRPVGLGNSPNFDAGQETPTPPVTPTPAPDPYPDGPRSSRFLLGDGFGLRPFSEERGVSFYVSSTQFEQGVEQRLLVDDDDPDRGLGLYVQTGLGDGNPNPIRWFLSVALCGNSPLPGREGDTFGIGFYDLGLSALAKSQAPGLRDEQGVELFYNLRITPGCHLTPDLQVLHPGLAPVDTALLFGVRLKLDF